MLYGFKVVRRLAGGEWMSSLSSAYATVYSKDWWTDAPRVPLRHGFGLTIWTNYHVARDHYRTLRERNDPVLLLVACEESDCLSLTEMMIRPEVFAALGCDAPFPRLHKWTNREWGEWEEWPKHTVMVKRLMVLDPVEVRDPVGM